ncbi:hypothetical protein P154DRAFT_519732 [Amniculicola lignicola CBS 123094]|uniref:SWI-SNF chromatin-remodeling complex protein n=1 Tax=Amniculicola lignicola CBS 123094 TaxID=1392246 RepID=A0A6A5WS85_9PLEO|nr:hypothetical protein P154DRAFT_519732 [Amniculicola lignicola CBS 123094]
MSSPFQFNQNPARSPLDRPPPNVFQDGQPPSFKTNVNRAKTKKWVEAKPYSYDGDDWGDVDEYDHYGAQEEPPPPAPAPTRAQHPGQRFAEPSRSFTDPQRQEPPHPARRNSFEAGDEHRAFQSGAPMPATTAPQSYGGQPYAQQPYDAPRQPAGPVHPGTRQPSAAQSDTSDTPQHRRDFTPSALPPPLTTKIASAPGHMTASPANTQFPPHKGSLSQMDAPTSAASPTARDQAPSSSGKPLPFIRPADIYKRVEEERQRERASIDSSRPSMDSLASPPKNDAVSQGDPTQPSLAPIAGVSAFNNDFWSSAPQPHLGLGQPSSGGPPGDEHGFRSAVDQAFTRTDDQRSYPPTPISKDTVSRSNTDSTSGISPIMSRVPSTATSGLKNRNLAGTESSTPAIAEEASEGGTPVSLPSSTAMLGGPNQIARKPSPGHSRNASNSSLPHATLATPSPGQSPARSPAIEPQKAFPEPERAQLSSLSPTSPSTREADIASALNKSPDKAASELGAVERESQNAFLESHQSTPPDAPPRPRSESPNKSRVQELANKFGEVSGSRRGSTQSNVSKQSWEDSPANSRPSSPTKASTSRPSSPTKTSVDPSSGERPPAAREASFRPKLPGQWESYSTSAVTPSDQGDRQLGEKSELHPAGPQSSLPLGEVDLAPTTSKHDLSLSDPSKPTLSVFDPLTALKAAGAAMGEAFHTSASESPQDRAGPTHGDVYAARPLYVDRAGSSVSVASSIPPTPPAKDTPELEHVRPVPPLKEKGPEAFSDTERTPTRPAMHPQLSTESTMNEQESDRLRNEIVASLTPHGSSATSNVEPGRTSLQPHDSSATNRESSFLPSEYDSYWAEGNESPTQQSQNVGRSISNDYGSSTDQPPVVQKPTTSQPQSGLLATRFSWEQKTNHQAEAGATEAPVIAQPGSQAPIPSNQQEANVNASQPLAGIPDHYFGPTHTAASASHEPVDENHLKTQSPTPPPAADKPANSPSHTLTAKEVSPTFGLHVINSDVNPEAVDMPLRLSKEISPVAQPVDNTPASTVSQQQPDGQTPAVTSPVSLPAPGPSTILDSTPKSPITDKPLGGRDIAAMKSSSERIATYNRTREYWANADHGLSDWISSAIAANPELGSQPIAQPAPPLMHSPTTSRHRPTASLSLFGKHGANSSQAQNASAMGQAVPLPSTPTASSSAPDARPGAASGGRSTGNQMQAKGKDLLHTAGNLGGKGLSKGMSSAKGLFAKGKSRFKTGSSDKATDSTPSSREASEEPELVSTPERGMRMSMDFDSPKEEKKRRRLSSPFHRSSRSRSRPSSIVLPRNAFLDFAGGAGPIPRSTPPRETPPAEVAEDNRPTSYHAPDSWNVGPTSGSQTTPPGDSLLPPERLGVLPSPAKSAFSLHQPDDDAPPVPPIPEGMDERLGDFAGNNNASHALLQSVINHASRPVTEPTRVDEDTGAGTSLNAESLRESDIDLASIISVGSDEDDEDDLPPQMDHEPVRSPSRREEAIDQGDDVSPPFVVESIEDGDISPVAYNIVFEPLQVDSDGRSRVADWSSSQAPTVVTKSIEIGDISPVSHHEPDEPFPNIAQPGAQPALQSLQPPAHTRGDVSPMLSAVKQATNGREDSPPPIELAQQPITKDDTSRAYLMEQIGAGDVSPISPARIERGTTTSAKEEPSSASTIRAPRPFVVAAEEPEERRASSLGPAVAIASGASTPQEMSAAPPQLAPQQQVNATPYQVVHAVQYVPSHSSFESWEQDSVAAPSQSEGSQLGERLDTRNVPPVPQMPSLVEWQQNVHQAASPERPLSIATGVSSLDGNLHPDSHHHQQHQHMELTPNGGGHRRSQSILSAISSAVSAERAPASPTSNQYADSRDRNLQVSPALSAINPVRTLSIEERAPLTQKTMAPPSDDGYDLYADHNGIVKDVRDERGEPLRVASVQPPVTAATPPVGAVPSQPQSDDNRRYSDERPMSFVSGPRDSDGRPQDQINRSTPGPKGNIPPVPRIPSKLQAQYQDSPVDPLYNPAFRANNAPPLAQPQQKQPSPDLQPVMQMPPPQGDQPNVLPQVSKSPPAQVSPDSQQLPPARSPPQSAVPLPPQSNASPPPQPSPPAVLNQRPLLQEAMAGSGSFHDPRMQDPRAPDPRLQDPRLQYPRLQGPRLQDPRLQDPRLQQPPNLQDSVRQDDRLQDPRLQAQSPLVEGPRIHPGQDPRQQDPRLQAQDPRVVAQDPRLQDPRLRDGGAQSPQASGPQSDVHDSRLQGQGPHDQTRGQQHQVVDARSQDPRLQDPRLQDPRAHPVMAPGPQPAPQDPRLQSIHPQDPRLQDPRLQDPRLQDPRMQTPPGPMQGPQPYMQDPRTQPQPQGYPPDPRMQGRPVDLGPQPRNQYELHQQMLQRQAMDPRFRAGGNQPPVMGLQQQIANLTKTEEKSSKHGIKSVFKHIGGKSSSHATQPPAQPNGGLTPSITVTQDPNRSASYQSSLGGLPTEKVNAMKKDRKSHVFGPMGNRPQSVGTESYISQDSTQVQAADSRLDLRYPASPAPFKGIPPQQPPPGVALTPQRAPMPATPDPKKKRFSALSGLFSRGSSTANAGPTKVKLSKEEKKAQKAQKHLTAPMQMFSAQQWPPQQQQQQQQQQQPQQFIQQQQQQQQLQYSQPSDAPRPFPGMTGPPARTISPSSSTQGTPQQYMPPQGFQRQQPQKQPTLQSQSTMQSQSSMQTPPPRAEGSAYVDTRLIAQARQAQQNAINPLQRPGGNASGNADTALHAQGRAQQQAAPEPSRRPDMDESAYVSTMQRVPQRQPSQPSPQPTQQMNQNGRPGMPPANASYTSSTQMPQGAVPLGGYYTPDRKIPIQEEKAPSPAPAPAPAPAQPPPPQAGASHPPPNFRRVSSPASPYKAGTLPASPQRHVSSPLAEPRYETPQIPAAYAPVSGPYTSPPSQSPVHTSQPNRTASAPYGPVSVRQPSDPTLHTLSPQVSQQAPYKPRTQSESSVTSTVSPISNAPPAVPLVQPTQPQRTQQRMSSISETPPREERPWNVNLPKGASEQDIVRARHQQYMVEQLAAVERQASSPSPHLSQPASTPSPHPPPAPNAVQGFREVLPRGSPQSYQLPQQQSQNPNEFNHVRQQEQVQQQLQQPQGPTDYNRIPDQQRVHSQAPNDFSHSQQQVPGQPQPQQPQTPVDYNRVQQQEQQQQQPPQNSNEYNHISGQGQHRHSRPPSHSPQSLENFNRGQYQQQQPPLQSRSPQPIQPAPLHPGQAEIRPAMYPLPTSPDPSGVMSPVNPQAAVLPPPPLPGFPTNTSPPPPIQQRVASPPNGVRNADSAERYQQQQLQPQPQPQQYQKLGQAPSPTTQSPPPQQQQGIGQAQRYQEPAPQKPISPPPVQRHEVSPAENGQGFQPAPPSRQESYPQNYGQSVSPPLAQQQVESIPQQYQNVHPAHRYQQQAPSEHSAPPQQPHYDEQPPDEPPPSYDGPGIPNEGMDKDRPRPPNIMTNAETRGRQRQTSIGILQHPQPASMAASPLRTSADMGADILRRQLLEQEDRERRERVSRVEAQRAESDRERHERERNRARARELERSISGGGRVGSLRNPEGSGRAGPERRLSSTTRVVYELPAEEDDEPVMMASSFPGQEWVPMWSED